MLKRLILTTYRAHGYTFKLNNVIETILTIGVGGDSDRSCGKGISGFLLVNFFTRWIFHQAGYDIIPGKQVVSSDEQTLELAPRTYNPSHPDYDRDLVKNYPGRIYEVPTPTDRTASSLENPVLRRIKESGICKRAQVEEILKTCAEELKDDPDYLNFQQKQQTLEAFIAELNRTQPGEFYPGSVSIPEAIFLYWLIRIQRPKVVVQTGTSNGVSCAFITLALKKNGDGGKLHAVDLPYIYNADDPFYQQSVVYGVLIPPGKTSGWLVPDGLQHSFAVVNGDAKELLPTILEKVGKVDAFYHDSDHSYDHMRFEFKCALPHLNPHGIIIADDISWSSVLWDFAEEIGCYAYNHHSMQGVLFL